MNLMSVFACQFFKINYLHPSKTLFVRTINLTLIVYGAVKYYRIRVHVTDAERTEKMQKMFIVGHPVMKVVSVAMRVFTKRARSA